MFGTERGDDMGSRADAEVGTLRLRCDVTATRLHRNWVLAGIGSNVSIFDKATCKLLQSIRALRGQKVYGLTPRDDLIMVHGGKQVCLLSAECSVPGRADVTKLATIECDDWILDAMWLGDDEIALLTTHNVVQTWDIKRKKLINLHASRQNSLLYSGLMEKLVDDILVFAGTVFSKVIVHRCRSEEPLQVLKGHKGVIFSIAWSIEKEMIMTTSDDRSVRLWSPGTNTGLHSSHKEYWENCKFVCKHTMYGHLSRVLRCAITPQNVVSVGEDSFICFWDFGGKLIRKIKAHQNGAIWSVSSDSTHVVTGGSDGAVILHPLTLAANQNCFSEVIDIDDYGTPKKIMFTARGNMYLYTSKDHLCYYNLKSKECQLVNSYNSTYKMHTMSSCKQLLAIVDANGELDVFLENCKGSEDVTKLDSIKFDLGRVCSAQWAGNRFLVVCCESGHVSVIGSDLKEFWSFTLPDCKEPWLTAAAVCNRDNILVLGDRCGNVYFYQKNQRTPLKTFRKVHGNLGATSITFTDYVITTGRDGTVKYFKVVLDEKVMVKLMHQINLPFDWIERFIDREGKFICGFHERKFVVHNVQDSRTVLDISCGGGHRAWDVHRYFRKMDDGFKEFIQFIHVRDSSTHLADFQIDKISSKTVVCGSHVKEINCLEIIAPTFGTESDGIYFIAGGEDTTLRISSHDLYVPDKIVFKHLSSIRTLTYVYLSSNKILVVSGGGRANICVRTITFTRQDNQIFLEAETLTEYLAKGTDKERRGNSSWRNVKLDVGPEMRIMCLQIVTTADMFMIIAACSDATLRIFKYRQEGNAALKPVAEIKYHKTCILKVHSFRYLDKDIAFTATTTGEVCLWDLSSAIKKLATDDTVEVNTEPVLKVKIDRSGLNSFSLRIIENGILMATGGDDNSINLILLKLARTNEIESIYEQCRWATSVWHGAQVTGLGFVDEYLISASIDQRVTVSRWSAGDEEVGCTFVDQYYTDVADVQGLCLYERKGDRIPICVFGKGIERMNISVPVSQ